MQRANGCFPNTSFSKGQVSFELNQGVGLFQKSTVALREVGSNQLMTLRETVQKGFLGFFFKPFKPEVQLGTQTPIRPDLLFSFGH